MHFENVNFPSAATTATAHTDAAFYSDRDLLFMVTVAPLTLSIIFFLSFTSAKLHI
jgi:hypothetical protein